MEKAYYGETLSEEVEKVLGYFSQALSPLPLKVSRQNVESGILEPRKFLATSKMSRQNTPLVFYFQKTDFFFFFFFLFPGASDLIRQMLTVSAAKRATIEDICSHWWVNEGYLESCLDVAEALANQTPVRLDLLLSLAPKHINSEHMLIQPEEDESMRVS